MGIFFLFYFYFVFFAPNSLGHPDNYIVANPMVTPTHIVPEWYFLPFYAILRSIPDKLGGVVAMFGSILILFALPWLDRSPVKSCHYRPIFKIFTFLFFIAFGVLMYIGGKPPEDPYLTIGRIFTFWYFLHLLVIIPLVSKKERPLPLPESIDSDFKLKKYRIM